MRKIAILTSGGDSPGMNAAIVAITNLAKLDKCEVFYIKNGYKGLCNNEIVSVDQYDDYQSFANKGGSFIGSSRFPEFRENKYKLKALSNLNAKGIKKLIVIGGDGSYYGAQRLTKDNDIICAGLPGTIDNDVVSSDYSIGFDTALNTAVDSIRKIQDTMESHHMCCIVELMGRHSSDLAIFAGIATNANMIVTHENNSTQQEIAKVVKHIHNKMENKGITIVLSEHVYDASSLAKFIQKETNVSTRACILGHTQRGGAPTAMEAYRASLMGWKAYNALKKAVKSFVVGWKDGKPKIYILDDALRLKNENRKNLVDFYNKIKLGG